MSAENERHRARTRGRSRGTPPNLYGEQLRRLLDSARRRQASDDQGRSLPRGPGAEPGHDIRTILEEVLAAIEHERSLPSLPNVIRNLDRVLETTGADAGDVADVLSLDPGLAARLLGLVNSVFYGVRTEVKRLDHAVALLGVDTIRKLVLGASVFKVLPGQLDDLFDPTEFWEHSVTTAIGARLIARGMPLQTARVDPGDAFLAGLLHDVGKILVSQLFSDRYRRIRELALEQAIPVYDAELAVMGARHTDIGHYLLTSWGIPEPITTAVRFHHEPGTGGMIARIVHVADLISHGLGFFSDTEEPPRLDPLVWVALNLPDSTIEHVGYQLLGEFEQIRTLLLRD